MRQLLEGLDLQAACILSGALCPWRPQQCRAPDSGDVLAGSRRLRNDLSVKALWRNDSLPPLAQHVSRLLGRLHTANCRCVSRTHWSEKWASDSGTGQRGTGSPPQFMLDPSAGAQRLLHVTRTCSLSGVVQRSSHNDARVRLCMPAVHACPTLWGKGLESERKSGAGNLGAHQVGQVCHRDNALQLLGHLALDVHHRDGTTSGPVLLLRGAPPTHDCMLPRPKAAAVASSAAIASPQMSAVLADTHFPIGGATHGLYTVLASSAPPSLTCIACTCA